MKGKWELADRIMKRLLSRPISRPFLIPCRPGEDFPDEYFAVIRKPMDFQVIKGKLKNRQYRFLKDWIGAVKLVFENTLTYYEEGNPIRDLAEELDAIFENECEIFSKCTVKGWSEIVWRLKDKIRKLNANPPFEAGKIQLSEPLSPHICTDKEISRFLSAMELMHDTKDHKAMAKILREEEPETSIGNETVEIDILSLRASTIRRLESYVKRRLGPKYPK
jgi:hypothetical protein